LRAIVSVHRMVKVSGVPFSGEFIFTVPYSFRVSFGDGSSKLDAVIPEEITIPGADFDTGDLITIACDIRAAIRVNMYWRQREEGLSESIELKSVSVKVCETSVEV